jgi:hypothetical protein
MRSGLWDNKEISISVLHDGMSGDDADEKGVRLPLSVDPDALETEFDILSIPVFIFLIAWTPKPSLGDGWYPRGILLRWHETREYSRLGLFHFDGTRYRYDERVRWLREGELVTIEVI